MAKAIATVQIGINEAIFVKNTEKIIRITKNKICSYFEIVFWGIEGIKPAIEDKIPDIPV